MKDKSEPTPLMVSPTAFVPTVSAPCDKGDDAGNDAELGCDKSNQKKNQVQSWDTDVAFDGQH